MLCYLFLLASIFISSSTSISYNDHCSSIVPQSKLTNLTHSLPIPDLSDTVFTGGERLLRLMPTPDYTVYTSALFKQSLNLQILPHYYQTQDTGIYQVQGILYVYSPSNPDDSVGGNRNSIKFTMKGFWSENSSQLCMVGSASYAMINFEAVLKLKYPIQYNPTVYTAVGGGTLESTISDAASAYFDPISFITFSSPGPLYNYSRDYVQSIILNRNPFCSVIGSIFMELVCREEDHNHCSPLGVIGPFLHLTPIDNCAENEGRKFRFKATFQNMSYDDGSFSLESTLIGEAVWDDKKKLLLGVACRLWDPLSHFGDSVGDCTMRLSLSYPSVLTIRNESKIVGGLWSSKAVNESGYFNKIDLISSDESGNVMVPFPGQIYEFTEMGRVRESCERKVVKKKGSIYPDGLSFNMKFDMSIKNSQGDLAWGSATPVSVGNDMVFAKPQYSWIVDDTTQRPVNKSPVNISYKISIHSFQQLNWSSWIPWMDNLCLQIEVSAEGVYNAETGYLCMVGCRKLLNNSTNSRDCEILVKFQFPPFDAKGGFIKGSIESTRAKTDSLHFDELLIEAAAYYAEVAEKSIVRMDMEITMVLVSNTLACIFIGLQIFHVKRNHEVPSVVSIVMLLILCVGHMIPLMLKFDVVLLGNHSNQNMLLSNGGRIEANEVTVRVISIVAFLLQIRLLQLVWTAKRIDVNETSWWNGEKKAGGFTLGLYVVGTVATLLSNWARNRYVGQTESLWGDLRSYVGLIHDGFLLPQILLNVFIDSSEKALSHPFYLGTSAVRLVPHVYNQYRMHNYPKYDLSATYYYANTAADFYSTAWDIIIPCGVIALAMVVFFQQRGGGRCILPKRLRALEMYKKVPALDIQSRLLW